jgi:hypothetical protein
LDAIYLSVGLNDEGIITSVGDAPANSRRGVLNGDFGNYSVAINHPVVVAIGGPGGTIETMWSINPFGHLFTPAGPYHLRVTAASRNLVAGSFFFAELDDSNRITTLWVVDYDLTPTAPSEDLAEAIAEAIYDAIDSLDMSDPTDFADVDALIDAIIAESGLTGDDAAIAREALEALLDGAADVPAAIAILEGLTQAQILAAVQDAMPEEPSEVPVTFTLAPQTVTLTNAAVANVTAGGTATGAITLGTLTPANADIAVLATATGVTVQFTGTLPTVANPAAITGSHTIVVTRGEIDVTLTVTLDIPAYDADPDYCDDCDEYPCECPEVTFTAGANGTLTAAVGTDAITSPAVVAEDTVVVFTAAPATGYRVASWTVNGTALAADDTRLTVNGTVLTLTIAADTTVAVAFEPDVVDCTCGGLAIVPAQVISQMTSQVAAITTQLGLPTPDAAEIATRVQNFEDLVETLTTGTLVGFAALPGTGLQLAMDMGMMPLIAVCAGFDWETLPQLPDMS